MPCIAAAQQIAEIVGLEGKGEFREAQQPAWRAAKVTQALFPSNFVRTGDSSKMALVFTDRTQIRLAQNSVLQIKESGSGKGGKTVVNLNAGRSWMQSKTAPGGLVMETPSALASIRGTDWEIVVEPGGRSILTVFSGEVEFYNEHGRVLVTQNEQASARIGQAPLKLQLSNPRDRIQWVSAVAVDARRYGDGGPSASQRDALVLVTALLAANDIAAAELKLRSIVAAKETDSVQARLVLADMEIYNGAFDAARQALVVGQGIFVGDARIDAGLARLALLSGDGPAAAVIARRGVSSEPLNQTFDARLVLGEAARFNGDWAEARAAYQGALQLRPRDARPLVGLGQIEMEKGNIGLARKYLGQALNLEADSISALAEEAALESIHGDPARAEVLYHKVLQRQPDNYVVLTGKAMLHFRQGDNAAALDALARALVIEPRYARAQIFQAVGLYRTGDTARALQALERVTALDPRDPLPHFLATLIRIDTLEPGAAVAEAMLAAAKLRYVKSLNQLASNQTGAANLGNALTLFGLENWSRHMAQESHLSLWSSSHLFLADRYAGDFSKRSELLQGFLLDPLVFGASNRRQPLIDAPGSHVTLSMRHNHSDDLTLSEPVVTAGGRNLGASPVAWFAEAIDTRIAPGSTPFRADARTLTVALGAKPSWQSSLFIYANQLRANIESGQRDVSGLFQKVEGTNQRVDAGGYFALDAETQIWLKAGRGRERSTVSEVGSIVVPVVTLVRASDFVTSPKASDLQLRFISVAGAEREYSLGIEAAQQTTRNALAQDAAIRLETAAGARNFLDSTDRDEGWFAYAFARQTASAWQIDSLLARNHYRKDRDFLVTLQAPVAVEQTVVEVLQRDRWTGALGAVYRPGSGRIFRLACQDWQRPASSGSLAPMAIAGIPLDDQLVFAGGKSRRCRAQLEWQTRADTFISFAAEHHHIDNLASSLDGVLNSRADVTNLDRLRSRTLPLPPKPDALEDIPIFSIATKRVLAASLEHFITPSFAARLFYQRATSRNSGPAFPGARIPYLPAHQLSVGGTWSFAARGYLSAQAVFRSERFSDEANAAKLDADWDLQLRGYLELDQRRWTLEAYATNLLRKQASDNIGVIVSFRF